MRGQLRLFDPGPATPPHMQRDASLVHASAREHGQTVAEHVDALHRAGVSPAAAPIKPPPAHLSPQFETLPAFLPASDIRDDYVEASGEAIKQREEIGDLWDRKATESRAPVEDVRPNADFTEMKNYPWGSGVYQSIKESGYDWSKPVNIVHRSRTGERFMGQGHHRVAAAAELEQETGKTMYIPISHIEEDF